MSNKSVRPLTPELEAMAKKRLERLNRKLDALLSVAPADKEVKKAIFSTETAITRWERILKGEPVWW